MNLFKNKTKEIYYVYKVSKIEKISVFIILLIIGFFCGSIFYKNLIGRFISMFLSLIFMRSYFDMKRNSLQNQILDEFLVINNLILGEVSSGISVDLAYFHLYDVVLNQDFSQIKLLRYEIEQWNKKLQLGYKIEDILKEFALNVEDNDIKEFSTVFKIAKRQGSNIVKVLESINLVIKNKINIKKEIKVQVAEKVFEQNIMSIMPFFMVLFLKTSCYDFIAPLYESVFGMIVMTVILLTFIGCYFWSNKMIDILK